MRLPAALGLRVASTLTGWTRPWPARCQVCGRWPSRPICEPCIAQWAPAVARCPRCAHRLSAPGARCTACPPADGQGGLQSVVAAVDYDYPWDQVIARFKFRDEPGWAGPLADLLLRQPAAHRLIEQSERVLPIPVTSRRLAERGYNQSWELIKAVRRRWGTQMPLCLPQALLRTGEAPDQHALPRTQRMNNLASSFWPHPEAHELLNKRRVLLVDDVSTTGTTLQRAAQALHEAGAISVSALVIARTHED